MRTTVKIILGIGALLILVGIFSLRGAGGDMEKLDSFASNDLPSLENVTNGTITLNDEDGKGEVGVTFWMEGEYSDENKNDVWDHCENINITITQHPETNQEWDERRGGDFYFETAPDERGEGFESEECDSRDENRNFNFKSRGLIKVGRACLACYSGTMVFESNMSVWVVYDDPVISLFMGGLGKGALGVMMCGCGLLFLIIAGLMAVLGDDDEPMPVVMQQSVLGQQPVMMQQQSAVQQAPPTIVISDGGQDPPSNT